MSIRNGRRNAAAVAALACTLALGVAVTATAATKGPQSTSVSCDGVTVKAGVSVTQGSQGGFSIKQNSSTNSSNTVVTARSSNGNDLPNKTIATGATASWTGVLPSTYTVRALRSGAANCNGVLPGHGNYTWNYTVTYVS